MTSSNELGENLKNLITALENYKPEVHAPPVIKLLYDAETGIVHNVTFEETDQPYYIITREQYNAHIHAKPLRVVNGKLEEIVFKPTIKLPLVEGNTWYTKDNNMLIMGTERGWSERTDY